MVSLSQLRVHEQKVNSYIRGGVWCKRRLTTITHIRTIICMFEEYAEPDLHDLATWGTMFRLSFAATTSSEFPMPPARDPSMRKMELLTAATRTSSVTLLFVGSGAFWGTTTEKCLLLQMVSERKTVPSTLGWGRGEIVVYG